MCEVEKNLVISMAHITPDDNGLLTNIASGDACEVIVYDLEYFFLVHCGVKLSNLQEQGFSEQFIKIMGLAKTEGFDYVKFDRDGPVYDRFFGMDIAKFDW